jgi:dolichol-phosphate mannosyltransferase
VLNVTIVLPTYNETQNIRDILHRIESETSRIENHSFNILVVDDYSPDGTGEVVKELTSRREKIHLLQGNKEGLGKAYIRGFRWVLEHLPESDLVFQMDADHSHDPAYIRSFLEGAAQGYDFVLGARYIPGGSCPDWSWERKLLSYWGNQYIRYIGGLTEVHDCTSGYRCIASGLLRKIDLDQLLTKGYSFQSMLLHQALKRGAKVKEIPIVFTDRRAGNSKLGKADVLECLKASTTLRFKRYRP